MMVTHFTLATRNLRLACNFFSETLGWQPLHRVVSAPAPVAWLEICPGQEVHLIELPDFQPSPFEREYGRHIAISYPAAGFAALKERLRAHGAEPMPPEREPMAERFFFRDPNGYLFEVVKDMKS
jgi:catechol 2,3-dioxygenase-like lactoylglutathione lyase family enzyme